MDNHSRLPHPILHLERLTKRYGALAAVDGLTLDIRQGEILGFLGPNGAGKTTTIHMVCGLLRPDSGEVYLDGVPLRPGDRRYAAKIGVCPQSVITWGNLTCLEQLEFMGEMYGMPRQKARRRGQELLDEMGLAGKCHQVSKHLSGGMLRRLNLILALVHDPEILILDEPEAGLDPQSRVLVREYIRSLVPQRTVVLTSHNMDEVERLAQRIAIIDRGKLLKLDTPEVLKEEVGSGDVLEIGLRAEDIETVCHHLRSLPSSVGEATILGSILVIHHCGSIGSISDLLDFFKVHGIQPSKIQMRTSTLEDVFITLTGRSLRD